MGMGTPSSHSKMERITDSSWWSLHYVDAKQSGQVNSARQAWVGCGGCGIVSRRIVGRLIRIRQGIIRRQIAG